MYFRQFGRYVFATERIVAIEVIESGCNVYLDAGSEKPLTFNLSREESEKLVAYLVKSSAPIVP